MKISEYKEACVLTVIESPYAGDVQRNLAYLDLCILDSIARGELPVASHKMYTTALDDLQLDQRKVGIELGWQFRYRAERFAFYIDHGWSSGMLLTKAKYDTDVISYLTRNVDLALIRQFLHDDVGRVNRLVAAAGLEGKG